MNDRIYIKENQLYTKVGVQAIGDNIEGLWL